MTDSGKLAQLEPDECLLMDKNPELWSSGESPLAPRMEPEP